MNEKKEDIEAEEKCEHKECLVLDMEHWEYMFWYEIRGKASEVDESSSLDWFSLTYGWAIGKGLSIEQSHLLALHIRYHTDLG